ncbi:hypothetical protein GOP47_0005571 [Adiantum capillus-veneris]|uniref:Uncharacterized protein n=1 Tax=Adiantum capillus-veneris TaxID=13818 RepID=A0A9D4ZND1_ADICA|nr:hypothetical protein GOP47_0005571 [Adiantum capillus-veneris]
MNTQLSTPGSSTPPTTAVGTDNLTSQIAGMSKHQLYQIVSQMKDLIQQNQQQARQILIANPQLTKTLFQAQIMLGMVRAPDTLPPVQPGVTMATAQPSQQSSSQTPTLQVPATPSSQSGSTFQPLSSPLPASQQPPPQMASPYLQQSQAASVSSQSNQPSFAFQQSVQTPSHSSPVAALQPPVQQAPSQPPLPSLPPPLPQQPRPLTPPSQVLQQNTQGMGFTSPPVPQAYHPQPSYMQQGGPSSQQANVAASFQQMHAPPLPSQPLPQHMFQVPGDMGGNASAGLGGMLLVGGAVDSGRGLNMGVPSASAPSATWNQALPSSGSMGIPQVTPTGHMVPGQPPFVGGVGLSSSMAPGPGSNQSQVFNQPLAQPQPPQQPQHQPQMQMPIELEQQKALLQQVMNLTPEQINSLPPEQRQQVLQLQQAFRSQTG